MLTKFALILILINPESPSGFSQVENHGKAPLFDTQADCVLASEILALWSNVQSADCETVTIGPEPSKTSAPREFAI